jgi:hypothetical protein
VTDDDSEQASLDDIAGTADETASDDRPAGTGTGDGSDRPGDTGDQSAGTGNRDPPDPTGDVAETVEMGVALLAHLEDSELSLAGAVDRIETLTTDPAVTREILDTAELRGVIDREEGIVRPRSGAFVRFERDVVQREGEFTCRRCGASLSTGHFIRFDAGEHGPFGSSCIRKVTGRE